ncbi:MAG TPA: hypothetical protein VHA52_00880, partial [Candidatus Babeliaceae bacterium]|nr:hypothetical protein [Candidatus Babeliaceae bacterium]
SKSPNRSKLGELLQRIEETLAYSSEVSEFMQLYNTLSTIYFYLQEYSRSRAYLKKAIALTAPSQEYHIYTLANLALHFKFFRWETKALSFLERARSLALKGQNFFALRQIEGDYSFFSISKREVKKSI